MFTKALKAVEELSMVVIEDNMWRLDSLPVYLEKAWHDSIEFVTLTTKNVITEQITRSMTEIIKALMLQQDVLANISDTLKVPFEYIEVPTLDPFVDTIQELTANAELVKTFAHRILNIDFALRKVINTMYATFTLLPPFVMVYKNNAKTVDATIMNELEWIREQAYATAPLYP